MTYIEREPHVGLPLRLDCAELAECKLLKGQPGRAQRTENYGVTARNRIARQNSGSTRESDRDVPQKHLADEAILVHRLLVLTLRQFCPHLRGNLGESQH